MTARNQSLDALRGAAVLLVIFYHCYRIVPFGWIGVDLFFVLSGFLISGLLFTELQRDGKMNIGRFLFRRGMKIYPPYFVFLLLTSLFVPELRHIAGIESAFLQNYYYGSLNGSSAPTNNVLWIHTWSLAVEEHFYLMLPFVLALLANVRKLRWVPAISASLIIGCFIGRAIELRAYGDSSGVFFHSHLRADSLFAGVALGYVWHHHRERFLAWSKKPMIYIAPLLLIPAAFGFPSPIGKSITVTANLLAFALLLLWAIPRNIGFVSIARIGQFSYSIYLWHTIVGDWRVTGQIFKVLEKARDSLFSFIPTRKSLSLC